LAEALFVFSDGCFWRAETLLDSVFIFTFLLFCQVQAPANIWHSVSFSRPAVNATKRHQSSFLLCHFTQMSPFQPTAVAPSLSFPRFYLDWFNAISLTGSLLAGLGASWPLLTYYIL